MTLLELLGWDLLDRIGDYVDYYKIRDAAINAFYRKLRKEGMGGRQAREKIIEEFTDLDGNKLVLDDKGLQKILYVNKRKNTGKFIRPKTSGVQSTNNPT